MRRSKSVDTLQRNLYHRKHIAEQNEPVENDRLGFRIGDKCIWNNNGVKEHGIIKYIGFLKGHRSLYAGVEFENRIGAGTGIFAREQLFYSKNGHAAIVELSSLEKKKLRNFDASSSRFSDVILIVEDRKYYVSKLYLASQSTYFEALFLRDFEESKKTEIEIKDVNPDDFQNFLELLHGESPIDESTIEGIVHLADMYDAKLAIRKCEEFLTENSEKTLKEKLELAHRYNLLNESSSRFSDVILIVEDRNFHVSKLFLASQSAFFKSLFLDNSEKLPEYTLSNANAEDFQNFLELLYGESPIDESTIEGIVHLADMYDAKSAIRKCEEFLMENSEKTLKEKLELAHRYKLLNLKIKCLSRITTAAEIRSVLLDDTNEMDPSVVGALLQKSLSLLP